METTTETSRVLRGETTAILRAWQTEVQTHLWHLDKRLFVPRGAAQQCASDTLDALIAYFQAREAPLRTLDGGALPGPAGAPPDAEKALAQAADAPPSRLLAVPALQQHAADWVALPVAWADQRAMLEILLTHTHQTLTTHRAERDTLTVNEGAFTLLIATAADQHVLKIEQVLSTEREEAVINRHLAGRFLGNASHDLRTPLTAVLGFAELLLEGNYGAISPEQRTILAHIENSAQNLLEIVNNLLDALQIRAGKLSPQYRPLEVAPLLHNLYAILLPLANRRKVGFTYTLPDDLGMIEADENILRHIVYQLLASALRATPANGQVTLSAERQAGILAIRTQDTALHLPPEAVANMADPFPLLENSPARGYEGWEVGLPLIRRYIDLHGGDLALTSLPEQGTVFTITLPVQRPAQRDAK